MTTQAQSGTDTRVHGGRLVSGTLRAHGVSHLIAHLNGEKSLAEAARWAKLDTCRYAKRQLMFARHQLGSFRWLTALEAETLALADCSDLKAARK